MHSLHLGGGPSGSGFRSIARKPAIQEPKPSSTKPKNGACQIEGNSDWQAFSERAALLIQCEYRALSMTLRDYFFIVPPGVVASPFFSTDPAVPAP
jgi:hypothetical protein